MLTDLSVLIKVGPQIFLFVANAEVQFPNRA